MQVLAMQSAASPEAPLSTIETRSKRVAQFLMYEEVEVEMLPVLPSEAYIYLLVFCAYLEALVHGSSGPQGQQAYDDTMAHPIRQAELEVVSRILRWRGLSI